MVLNQNGQHLVLPRDLVPFRDLQGHFSCQLEPCMRRASDRFEIGLLEFRMNHDFRIYGIRRAFNRRSARTRTDRMTFWRNLPKRNHSEHFHHRMDGSGILFHSGVFDFVFLVCRDFSHPIELHQQQRDTMGWRNEMRRRWYFDADGRNEQRPRYGVQLFHRQQPRGR